MKYHDKCPKCGCQEFYGNQRVFTEVVVDAKGNFQRNAGDDGQIVIGDSDEPYGPFTCVKCKAEYDELPIEVDEGDQIEELVAILKASGHDIDEIVHDIHSALASTINNGGIEVQARFLLDKYHGNIDLIKRTLE